jgi:hypothetical protein
VRSLSWDENPTACPGDARGVARFACHPYHALRRLQHRRGLDRVRDTPQVVGPRRRHFGRRIAAEDAVKSRPQTLGLLGVSSTSLIVMSNP